MKYNRLKYCATLLSILISFTLFAQTGRDGFAELHIDSVPHHVQPMTGIVFWQDQYQNKIQDASSLEFSYMLFNDVVSEQGVYDWSKVESKLNDIASRHHQAIFRFRYVYVGEETSVPDYIKALPDYHETEGISEGETTWFPDWTNQELKDFTLDFYTHFAQRYDNDPRLAFIEVGFGLWAEYHIYDGPFILGQTFPSKAFQESFFNHLDTTFVTTPFMISIDAASDEYSPFAEVPALLDIPFGLFDDSFMHEGFDEPGEYNTESWNFFDRNRYQVAPAGGEFSYYTSYDQQHVLDYPDGPYGKPFEYFANDFHITFIIGNDQAIYQTPARIKQASMAAGYLFKITSFLSKQDSSIVTVKNVGVAPFYYDAYVSVDGIRSTVSLKYLLPGDSIICPVSAGGSQPVLTIESDRLVEGQVIEYLGTENHLGITKPNKNSGFMIYPNPVEKGSPVYLKASDNKMKTYSMMSSTGQIVDFGSFYRQISINTTSLKKGLYIITVNDDKASFSRKVIVK